MVRMIMMKVLLKLLIAILYSVELTRTQCLQSDLPYQTDVTAQQQKDMLIIEARCFLGCLPGGYIILFDVSKSLILVQLSWLIALLCILSHAVRLSN